MVRKDQDDGWQDQLQKWRAKRHQISARSYPTPEGNVVAYRDKTSYLEVYDHSWKLAEQTNSATTSMESTGSSQSTASISPLSREISVVLDSDTKPASNSLEKLSITDSGHYGSTEEVDGGRVSSSSSLETSESKEYPETNFDQSASSSDVFENIPLNISTKQRVQGKLTHNTLVNTSTSKSFTKEQSISAKTKPAINMNDPDLARLERSRLAAQNAGAPPSWKQRQADERVSEEVAVNIRQKPNHEKGFGFLIKGGKELREPLTVSAVFAGSHADKAGIAVADELMSINGHVTSDRTHMSAKRLIESALSKGELNLLLRRYKRRYSAMINGHSGSTSSVSSPGHSSLPSPVMSPGQSHNDVRNNNYSSPVEKDFIDRSANNNSRTEVFIQVNETIGSPFSQRKYRPGKIENFVPEAERPTGKDYRLLSMHAKKPPGKISDFVPESERPKATVNLVNGDVSTEEYGRPDAYWKRENEKVLEKFGDQRLSSPRSPRSLSPAAPAPFEAKPVYGHVYSPEPENKIVIERNGDQRLSSPSPRSLQSTSPAGTTPVEVKPVYSHVYSPEPLPELPAQPQEMKIVDQLSPPSEKPPLPPQSLVVSSKRVNDQDNWKPLVGTTLTENQHRLNQIEVTQKISPDYDSVDIAQKLQQAHERLLREREELLSPTASTPSPPAAASGESDICWSRMPLPGESKKVITPENPAPPKSTTVTKEITLVENQQFWYNSSESQTLRTSTTTKISPVSHHDPKAAILDTNDRKSPQNIGINATVERRSPSLSRQVLAPPALHKSKVPSNPSTAINADNTRISPTSQSNDKTLSVSGHQLCSHCGEELGRGAAMIIESLKLFYHFKCFRCSVCGVMLGNGSQGTDVRVRGGRLHCQSCFSNEADGTQSSQV